MKGKSVERSHFVEAENRSAPCAVSGYLLVCLSTYELNKMQRFIRCKLSENMLL